MEIRIEIKGKETLAERWGSLCQYEFEYLRRDKKRQHLKREVYNRGDSAAVLIINPVRKTIILIRQFRMPAFVRGNGTGFVVEVPAGLIEGQAAEHAIIREIEEEVGLSVRSVTKVMEVFSNPAIMTEVVHLYISEYCGDEWSRFSGGGVESEGEDIEVLEIPIREVMTMIKNGAIMDGKTIILILFAALNGYIQFESS